MRADRVLGDEETLGDFVRAEMVVQEEQHLELARRQGGGDCIRHSATAPAARPHLFQQAARDGTGEGGLSVRDPAQELHDPRRRLTLEEVAGSAPADHGEQIRLLARGREYHDLARRRSLAQSRERREPVQPGHRQIE